MIVRSLNASISKILDRGRRQGKRPPTGESANQGESSEDSISFGTYFSDMEKRKTGLALRFFLLTYIIILAYPFYIFYLNVGIDPSWEFALNHLVNSHLVFGKDIIFTYGPLGFLNCPEQIGSNAPIALICHLSAWLLFAAVLFYGTIKRLFSLDQLFLFAIIMIPLGRLSFDYFIGFLILLLLSFSLYVRNWLPSFLLAILLTTPLFFIKFTSILFALPAILAISSFQILTDRNRGLLQLGLSSVLIPLLFTGAYLLYNPSFADMLAYLRGSFELSSEYSVAMSLPGIWYEILSGINLYRCISPCFHPSLSIQTTVILAFPRVSPPAFSCF